MLDFVAVAMILVTAIMFVSVFLVKYRLQWRLHRQIQIALGLILLVTIVAFEVDLQLFTNWEELAKPSPFFASGWVHRFLWAHLLFAIPTPILWGYLIVWSLLRQGRLASHEFAAWHRRMGWISVIMMSMTAITGWVFYWVGFVA